MLFDTAMNIEWTTFEDNLKGLFIHELTHAITLNTRSPFYRFLHRFFGNWATPAFWTAPAFMLEGAPISMESLGGFGRANDPFARHYLRQALHEGKFHTPFQASGVYDFPGQRYLFYEYGGFFSAWLQQQFGMEKYAELWQAMGKSGQFSIFAYRSGFYNIFRRVYNMDFIYAWNTFRDSLALDNIEENQNEILPGQYRFFSENRNSFPALAASKNEVFILDRTGKIHVYNSQTGNTRTFNSGLFLVYDLDVSACGTTLLVSGYQAITGDRFRAVVIEHRTDSGRRTGRVFHGLYRARYFRDGVIGIRTELHNNKIVYEDFNGNREILFQGNQRLMFSGPQAVDNDRIAFIAARNGARELLLYNYVSGELFRIENSTDNNDYWRFMRNLNVSEGRLLFSHNANDRMYKFASIDLESMQAIFSTRDFSGSVFNPVSVNGNIYYRANFFSGDNILRFPETITSLSGEQTNINFAAPAEDYRLAAQRRGNTQEALTVQPHDNNLPPFESRPYFTIRYMNPFDFWLPLPLIRVDTDFNFSLDGGGILSVIMDPTDRHLIIAMAYADTKYQMANVELFTWQNTVAGFPIALEFSDTILTNSRDDLYRNTRVSLIASFSQIPGRWRYGFSFGGGYYRIAEDDGRASAYDWEKTESGFLYSATLSFSTLTRRQHELFGTGMSLGFRGISIVEDFHPRLEGRFRASTETRFPLGLVLYGVYDERGMNLHGSSRTYGGSLFRDSASVEYTIHRGLNNLLWIAGAELSLGLFSFEIQRNLSHVYFNRFFCTLAVRNVLYNSDGHFLAEGIEMGDFHLAQSLVLNLGLISSITPLRQVPLFLEPRIWGAWKFSNTITGKGDIWQIGAGFNFQY